MGGVHFPTVISFYTPQSFYHWHVHDWLASFARFQIPCFIEPIESKGSWEANCAHKPFFILDKLNQLQIPLLWVDVDAVMVRAPSLEGLFSHNFSVFSDETLPWDHPSKIRSGAIYIKPSSEATDLLQKWIGETKRQLLDPKRGEEFWDQVALRDVLSKEPSDRWGILPLSYVYIFDHPLDEKKCKRPYVIHKQQSRISKRFNI